MDESALLAHIYERSSPPTDVVPVGPGDDCAVVRVAAGVDILLTTDQLVEGRHYTPGVPVDQVGRKAIARCLSDIAAMGGRPDVCLAAATLGAGSDGADELFDALRRTAEAFRCPLVGGDIAVADGPTVLTVTAVGRPHPERGPVLRSEARPGDRVCVTGVIGDSLASGRHLTFEPRLAEGAWLCDTLGEGLGAMIDLSDGLGRDAGRVATASAVRVVIDGGALPLAPGVTEAPSAIAAGEDYELLFTCRDEPPALSPSGVAVTVIGAVEAGSGCDLRLADGSLLDITHAGWDHRG